MKKKEKAKTATTKHEEERAKEEAKVAEEVDKQLSEALHPEEPVHGEPWEEFTLKDTSEGGDGKDHTFQIRTLNHRGERLFRKYALPIIGAELRPFETFIKSAMDSGGDIEPMVGEGISRSFIAGQLDIDDNIHKAIGAICTSQDPKARNSQDRTRFIIKWGLLAEDQMGSERLRDIFDKQVSISKAVDALGKSLRTSFGMLAKLVGKDINLGLDFLKPGSTQPASSTSEPTGKTDTTSSK